MAKEDYSNFVATMLNTGKEKKKEVKPQNRTEGVNKDDIAKMAENILEMGGKSGFVKNKRR